jgi:hypothetical protein
VVNPLENPVEREVIKEVPVFLDYHYYYYYYYLKLPERVAVLN